MVPNVWIPHISIQHTYVKIQISSLLQYIGQKILQPWQSSSPLYLFFHFCGNEGYLHFVALSSKGTQLMNQPMRMFLVSMVFNYLNYFKFSPLYLFFFDNWSGFFFAKYFPILGPNDIGNFGISAAPSGINGTSKKGYDNWRRKSSIFWPTINVITCRRCKYNNS